MTLSPRVKINPNILTWAREWYNMSPDYVAKKMHSKSINSNTIISWESGDKQPTYSQLKQLSNILHKPLEIFLYPSIPDIQKPVTNFRSIYGASIDNLPTDVLEKVITAKVFQDNLREITRGKTASDKLITNYQITSSLEDSSEDIRKILGVSLIQQKQFGRYDKGFEIWRSAFAKAGIYVFKSAFATEDYSGFCLSDSEFPVICINNKLGYQRQIFTLFHELYHLLSKENGLDIIKNKEDVYSKISTSMQSLERKCDEFASEFLVPTRDFRNEIINVNVNLFKNGKYEQIINDCVKPLAKKYCVSLDVILGKYRDVGIISSNQWNSLRSINLDIKRNTNGNGGGDYYNTQVAYLGRPYIQLVLEAQDMYGTPDFITAEYLRVSPKNLPRLVEAAMKGGE